MIDILLSTYNGEAFLEEQLNSLLNQTISTWKALIRDDGSSDSTTQIIKRYCDQYPSKFLFIDNIAGNIGTIKSFEVLLERSNADYIMFCDQDDVWLPNKIELSFQKLKALENEYGNNIPLLVHTDLQVVDQNLRLINKSFWQHTNLHPHITDNNIFFMGIVNTVTGCTVIMNKEAKLKSIPFPAKIRMHDAYIAIAVMQTGKLDYLETPTILYRQHANNAFGATSNHFSLKEKFKQIKTVFLKNKETYQLLHPLVFKNVFVYAFYKIKYIKLAYFAR